MLFARSLKILIITYAYFPRNDPRSFRWAAIAEDFAGQDHHVDVVCSRPVGTIAVECRNQVNIHRLSDPGSYLKRDGGNQRDSRVQDLNAGLNRRDWQWMNQLTRNAEKIWRWIRWPDYSCLWILPAFIYTRKLLKRERYDVVVSVSHPFSSHVVGYLIRELNFGGAWVCDIGDPFAFFTDIPMNNLRLYRRWNVRAERNILDHADMLSVTNSETAVKYSDLLGIEKKKIKMIPPLLSISQETLERVTKANELEEKRTRIINLVFMGRVYSQIRNPEYLLRLLATVTETEGSPAFEMHFWGGGGDCFRYFETYSNAYGKWLYIHDAVDRHEALEVMASADIFVNISNVTSYQLPSKVIEYAAFGKPILNISFGLCDSSAIFMKNYPLFCNIVADKSVTVDTVHKMIRFMNGASHVKEEDVRHFIEPYLIENVAKQYMEAFADILGGTFSGNHNSLM